MIANMKMGTLALLVATAFLATATRNSNAQTVACADDAGSLSRAQFTTEVKEREPTDKLDSIAPGTQRITFFSEINDANGAHFTYNWYHDGELTAEVPINISADRWRSWTSKQVDHLDSGEWQVKVVGEDGCVLGGAAIAYE